MIRTLLSCITRSESFPSYFVLSILGKGEGGLSVIVVSRLYLVYSFWLSNFIANSLLAVSLSICACVYFS